MRAIFGLPRIRCETQKLSSFTTRPALLGWHDARGLDVPANMTLVALPAYSPELNPVERLWLYLKERFLSHRLLDDYNAILEAACRAWNNLTTEPGRVKSLCSYDWITEVKH